MAFWDSADEGEAQVADYLPPTAEADEKHRPYFEVLSVTAADPSRYEQLRHDIRRLRRVDDPFVYELVQAGSFEDAIVAVLANPELQAVVIGDGFGFRSQREWPDLRDLLDRAMPFDPDAVDVRDYGLKLAWAIKRIRPELDVYLLTERGAEAIAARPEAAWLRRIFYGVEELMELHLSILDGVGDRYDTPYFTNLKRYSQKPVGTFHALPVARGKSVFRSKWIRDMGHFYGTNLFLAESSATTGGLDSLLEPTGNIKRAQEMAARAFGADRAYFVTNGTSTSNKIVLQALLAPGDIVLIDRNCHKSHHYAMVLSGAQPLYLEAYPMTAYSMYGAVPLRSIKKALLALKAEGKLDRAKLVDLTNCTFDGHMYNPERVMEECLAIKPDLVFLWDEAWFGFARFSPFHRLRTSHARRREPRRTAAHAGVPEGVRRVPGPGRGPGPGEPGAARHAAAAGPRQGEDPRLRHPVHPQVHVGAPPGLHDPGPRRGVRVGAWRLRGGLLHAHLHVAEPADHRVPGPGPPADGAGGLRARHPRHRPGAPHPAAGQQPPADLEVLPRARRRPRWSRPSTGSPASPTTAGARAPARS